MSPDPSYAGMGTEGPHKSVFAEALRLYPNSKLGRSIDGWVILEQGTVIGHVRYGAVDVIEWTEIAPHLQDDA